MQADRVDGDGGAHHARAARFTISLHGRESRPRLDDRIVDPLLRVGALLAETTDRDVDQIGGDRAQDGFADPHAIRGARAKVLHEDISSRHEPLQKFDTGRLFEIDHDRAFAAVARCKQRADPRSRAANRAHEVALPRRFDFDDVGALLGEHHGRDGSGNHRGQIDDPISLERPIHGVTLSLSVSPSDESERS